MIRWCMFNWKNLGLLWKKEDELRTSNLYYLFIVITYWNNIHVFINTSFHTNNRGNNKIISCCVCLCQHEIKIKCVRGGNSLIEVENERYFNAIVNIHHAYSLNNMSFEEFFFVISDFCRATSHIMVQINS